MNLKGIKNAVTSKLGRQILIGQKHSPEILFAAGVIGVVATVVVASRATLKLTDVLAESEANLETARTLISPKYSDADRQRDIKLIKMKAAGNIAKLYLPAAAIGAIAITFLTGSHVVLSRRNMGLTVAYATVDKAFKEYRKRVIDEYGNDKDEELRFGHATREIVEETNEGPVVRTIAALNPSDMSQYARFFDEGNANYQREPEYNRIFLQCQQNYFNDRLNARGHVFLNEVYDALGLARTRAGAVVGWVLQKGNDNFIDFGIFNSNSERARAFINGWESNILLDFNVDGVIFDKI